MQWFRLDIKMRGKNSWKISVSVIAYWCQSWYEHKHNETLEYYIGLIRPSWHSHNKFDINVHIRNTCLNDNFFLFSMSKICSQVTLIQMYTRRNATQSNLRDRSDTWLHHCSAHMVVLTCLYIHIAIYNVHWYKLNIIIKGCLFCQFGRLSNNKN